MWGVGQNGLSWEICLDYCFQREAYLKEERALQSQNRLFPNDYHNGRKSFVKEKNSSVKCTSEVFGTLEKNTSVSQSCLKTGTHLWTLSRVILFFQVTASGESFKFSMAATEVKSCISSHCRLESLSLKGAIHLCGLFCNSPLVASTLTRCESACLVFCWRAAVAILPHSVVSIKYWINVNFKRDF